MAIKKVIVLDTYFIKESKTNKRYILPVSIAKKSSDFLIHSAMIKHQVFSAQKTSLTKTRGKVRGGGRKPWSQKGLGRARTGSIRSPLWRGGGVIFGPSLKKAHLKLNKKERKLALQSLLFNKRKDILLIEDLESIMIQPKTKVFLDFCKCWTLNVNQKILIVVSKPIIPLILSTRNVKNIDLILASKLSLLDLISTKHLVLTPETLSIFEEIFYD